MRNIIDFLIDWPFKNCPFTNGLIAGFVPVMLIWALIFLFGGLK